MKILGISPFHDSSVCLLNDGKVEVFYKEERLSKAKRDVAPFTSIARIVNKHPDIDVALICSPTYEDSGVELYIKHLKKSYGIPIVEDMSDAHHLQHASLAFYDSGFDKALVIVIDRNGSYMHEARESESVFIAEYPGTFKLLYRSGWTTDISKRRSYQNGETQVDILTTHGITRVYESATRLIKQPALENGKTMGLAAYGSYRKEFDNLFIENNVGNFNVLSDADDTYAINRTLHHLATEDVTQNNYEIYADYAYAVQEQTQRAALWLIKKYVQATGITNVCITGGYGLNVVANGFFRENLPNVNFFFEPIADDTGNSIGGPMIYHRVKTQDKEIRPLKSTFFHGEPYSLEEVKGKKTNVDDVAQTLVDGKTVALFYGLAEAGPRALGHRSILYDPRDRAAKNKVNEVKKREWYRPFAGIMLKEDAEKYFYDVDMENSKYMTVNFKAKPQALKDIPGVIHVDNTCRIQVIEDDTEPVYKLLVSFKKKTGIGILLNTSFNLAGQPLVDSPQDALWTLDNSVLDYVWFPEKKIIVG